MALEDQDPQSGSPEAGHDADPITAPGTDTTPQVDWEQRFNGFRASADPKITRLSQYEQAIEDFQSGDPEQMRRAAAILNLSDHLEIPDPEPEYDADDPMAALQAQVNELSGKLTAAEQRDQEAQVARIVEERLSKIESLDDADRGLVLAQAINMPADVEGLPDIQAAYDALVARDRARIEAAQRDWAKGKTPTSIAPGTTGTQQENIMEMSPAQLRERDRMAIERAALQMQET
ncbi:MAG TPA: hypothetical protein VE645_18885 [Pseudonocardiaceae bacterium]|jgi:hypothetical protein|nr:hypothetical protein [Pseudonocardiaceae bacterium]